MKKEYYTPKIIVENLMIDDVILVSSIDKNHDIGNSQYDDNF